MLVIVNADDFGSSADTVRATIECFDAGALTSATIMPGMDATIEALTFARTHPEFSFGVHLTFTGDGREAPLTAPEAIRTLVGADGRFLPAGTIRRSALFRQLSAIEIEQEVAAQINAVREAGVAVSHVDSHRHLHKFAPFRAALARVLPRFGIDRVRNVQDVYLRRPLQSPTYWLAPVWRKRVMRRFATTSHFYMPASAGDVSWEEPLLRAARTLRGRTLEVGVHPGYEEPWRDGERRSTLAFAAAARAEGHRLVCWKELPDA